MEVLILLAKPCFMQTSIIHQKIYDIRGQKVMLDFDLAELYEVETRVLNQAVKRNAGKFPEDFMFGLFPDEWKAISSSQFVMMNLIPKNRTGKYLPYAFTEHGVTMLASVLRSEKAVAMNIAIVRAFIALRRFALQYKDLADQINEIRQTVGNHNERLDQIYDAIENLLNEKAEQKAWLEKRERIGFKRG
jgi:phage regulator Rha-like protein